MDLSINKINYKNNINFKGLEGAYNEKSTPVYKFYAPAHSKDEEVYLDFATVHKDQETGEYKYNASSSIPFDKQSDTLELDQAIIRSTGSGFAYRYRLKNIKTGDVRFETDSFKTIKINKDGDEMNVIEQGRMYGISPKAGAMRHSFLDSDVRVNANNERLKADKNFVRNHFNKLGGSIKGLLFLLTNESTKGELAPYRYFMTTPDIGVDKVSSHRYWPSNHYQCSDYETFKKFNAELFKQGKGYVADGAFTSQGLQSPLVQHVLKWGERSAFYNMLKIDSRLSLGILPDREFEGVNPYDHIGVRLVNGRGENYDKNKPTYIQFYDDRLLSQKAQNDGELHFDYDSAPADHYDIVSHQDSVQPYAFEIDPKDPKVKEFKGKNAILLKDIDQSKIADFLTFTHFSIGEKNKVAGATYWDGNVDIIKMNLSNPYNNKKNREASNIARDYLCGVASYWTEAIQSHLILETAKNGVDKNLIQNNEINNYPEVVKSVENNSFNSLVISQAKQAQDYIKNFPLQSLETSDELSAIFAQPKFNELLLKKSGDTVLSLFNAALDRAIPKDKKDNAEYRLYVAKTYANDILRSIYAYALKPDSIKENGKIDTNKLREVTLKSIERVESASPEEEIYQVASKINNGLNEESIENISKVMNKELSKISLKDFKLAEAVVLQGKGGLNWRFDAAKDIGDLDAVRDGRKTFSQVWNGDKLNPGVQMFWADFVGKIKESNPSAYIINEVTSLGEFKGGGNVAFDKQLTAAWKAAGEPETYEMQPVYAKQVQFLNETNSTTTSEYSKGFNSFSEFAGVNPEKPVANQSAYNKTQKNAGRVKRLRDQMETLMKYNQPNPAIFSHMFVSNHDKPSVLHTLPLNMSIYMAEDLNTIDKADKEKIALLTGTTNLEHLCPKAVGVGLVMSETIANMKNGEKSYFSDEEKAKLKTSLQNLVLGKKDDKSKPSFKRAESFGVKPYEITIKDVIKNSGIAKDEKELENMTLDFHKSMMKNSMVYFERMWQAMNACVGVPTMYGGNEFVQTGYETPSKNVYLGIRNEVLHHLKDDKRYKEYFEKMQSISSLYQKMGLSVLRDGSPVSLQMTSERAELEDKYNEILAAAKQEARQKGVSYGAFNHFVEKVSKKASEIGFDKEPAEYGISDENKNHADYKNVKDLVEKVVKEQYQKDEKIEKMTTKKSRFEMWPIYRKNAKGEQVVSVITNLGMPDGEASWKAKNTIIRPMQINEIKIVDKNGNCPFENGTKLDKIDQFGKKTSGYIVTDGKIIANGEKKKIVLTDTVSIFAPEGQVK